MNLDERMASLQNKLNDKLNKLNGYDTSAAASFNTGNYSTPQQAMPQAAAPSSEQDFSFCPECGKRIAADSCFCPECGHNIAGESFGKAAV
ncbi:MAG: hypothetical protein J6Q73_03465, partial [Bacteroidaceae bacterium]|nr:hypothetical protein [Bacteroidaceae bacterium]